MENPAKLSEANLTINNVKVIDSDIWVINK